MFSTFLKDNEMMISLYESLYEIAENEKAYQISDYAAERLGKHKKHAWMVKSISKE
jgi:DNA-binding ferritin-like protein